MKTDKKSKNNLSQFRPYQTQKKGKSRCNHYQSTGLIPTQQQLQLFASQPTESDDAPYPLQIGYIPDNQRITPDKFCKLIHYESGLNIPGQFTYDEAKEILLTSRYWDFSLDRDRIPKCVSRLRSLLENICSGANQGGEADA